MTKITAWAIGEMDYGVDGRGKPTFMTKRIYDTEAEAKEHVFKPFEVREIEIDVNEELDALARAITARRAYLLRTYKPEAIIKHLLGQERVGLDEKPKTSFVSKPGYRTYGNEPGVINKEDL